MLHAWWVKFLEGQREVGAARAVARDTAVTWGLMTDVLQRGDACDNELISERWLDMTCVDECDDSLRAAVDEAHSRDSSRTALSHAMWEGEGEQLHYLFGECLNAPVDVEYDDEGDMQPAWRVVAVPSAPSATVSASESYALCLVLRLGRV